MRPIWLIGKSSIGKNRMNKLYSIDGNCLENNQYYKNKETAYKNYQDWGKGSNRLPRLYETKEECCGCYACYSVCPANAVFMEEDTEGFVYPVVDLARCIGCLCCLKVFPFKKHICISGIITT